MIIYFNSHARRRQQSPLPDPCFAHEPPHPVRCACDGRSVEWREGTQVSGEWRAAGKCRSVRNGWRLDSNLIQATVGTEITEKCKNALCTRCPLWLKIILILYFNSHGGIPTVHHFPTHAMRMSNHTRSAAPEMGGRSVE